MAIELARRRLVFAIAGGVLGGSAIGCASPNSNAVTLLGAWRRDGQDYIGLWDAERGARGVEIPYRAHEVLPDPVRPGSVIAVARRPGDFLARIDLSAMRVTVLRMIDSQFVANGHAVLTGEGDTLLVSENDAMSGEGFVAVYDAGSLECRGRYSTAGIGPHALMLEPGGSLLVANGGVLTAAQSGRAKLNVGSIDASLVRLDPAGRVLSQWRLSNADLSIRHMARSSDGTVGIALQSEAAAAGEYAPVFARFDGKELGLGEAPGVALAGYGGDVACIATAHGPLFAVSCTRAGLVAVFDSAGSYRTAYPLGSACALAAQRSTLIALSERGEVGFLESRNGARWNVSSSAPAWDNHAKVWQGD